MGNTKLANPAPLGLMGFGMTTILLNLHNVGYFALDGIILAMGIFYGGIAQIFAGLLEYKKGNTFLDVIGNNIANSATYGFKSGTASFADMFAGSKVGLGVKVAGIELSDEMKALFKEPNDKALN